VCSFRAGDEAEAGSPIVGDSARLVGFDSDPRNFRMG
jgi:hypothetical protein